MNQTQTETQPRAKPAERFIVTCFDGVGGLAGVGDVCDLRGGGRSGRVKLLETYGGMLTGGGSGYGGSNPNRQRYLAERTSERRGPRSNRRWEWSAWSSARGCIRASSPAE